ncbi:MAG: hypothetical protein IJW48_03060 [Clostridia bacterium]|nr:hypothetical protein [Clostridia bacterium]
MKSILFSGLAILAVSAVVFIGSGISAMKLAELEEALHSATDVSDYKEIEARFLDMENYLSLSIGDLELTEIRYSFTELIAFAECGSDDEAEAAKSRLLCYLEHERRLSGFGPGAIF